MNNIVSTTLSFLFLLFSASKLHAAVEYEEFLALKKVAHDVFERLRPSKDYVLYINRQPTTYTDPDSDEEMYWWNMDVNNASFFEVKRKESVEFHITIFGGFSKQEFMDPDGLAVTFCHELAHGLGGSPVKDNGTVTEGQADYYATKVCLPLFYELYPAKKDIEPSSGYIENLCDRKDTRRDKKYCIRAMNALHANIKFFELLGGSSYYDRASQTLVTEFDTTSTYYPDAQCRVDLMIHGILDLERPNCFDPNGIDRVL